MEHVTITSLNKILCDARNGSNKNLRLVSEVFVILYSPRTNPANKEVFFINFFIGFVFNIAIEQKVI